MTAARHALDESFGRQQVASDERRSRIRRVFAAIAPRYDLMNDLMSFGIHRLWKRTLVRRCRGIHGIVVDLAGGTGDVARRLDGGGRRITVCDPCREMMLRGRRPTDKQIRWLAGEAESLPFADNSIDLLTIAFGIRNVTQLSAALAEIHRVLAPGGRFVCLEFSRPHAWLAPFYNFFSWQIIPRLGAAVAQSPIAYQYLVESIRRFPYQHEFAGLIAAAGFADVRFENLSFGIACLHFGTKPTDRNPA
jgi:demethylmenaquinone methyltransferase/2-methoxy-6-polyprenyl-1,4-benzoquinol methylase